MKPLDLTKPLQTVGGEHAELVYNGLSGPFPLAVVIHFNDGTRIMRTFRLDGSLYGDDDSQENLRNVPERGECWVNIYSDGSRCSPSAHRTRERADEYARHDRIACVRVEYEEGEGL